MKSSSETLYEEIKAVFRLVGDNVHPDMITLRTGIQPSEAHSKGDVVAKHPNRIYPTGYWGIDSSVPSGQPLDEHLKYLLDILEPKTSVIKEFEETGLCPNFFCGFFTTKAEFGTLVKLESNTLSRMAHLGASLDLNIYCCDESDDEVASRNFSEVQ